MTESNQELRWLCRGIPTTVMIPQTRLVLYLVTQPVAIRGPHRAEHVRHRHRWWTGLHHTRPEHLLDCSNRTGSGDGSEKDRFLGGTARGLNKVPSKSSSGNDNGQRRMVQWM